MDAGNAEHLNEPDWAAFIAIDWADRKHDWAMEVPGQNKRERGQMASSAWVADTVPAIRYRLPRKAFGSDPAHGRDAAPRRHLCSRSPAPLLSPPAAGHGRSVCRVSA